MVQQASAGQQLLTLLLPTSPSRHREEHRVTLLSTTQTPVLPDETMRKSSADNGHSCQIFSRVGHQPPLRNLQSSTCRAPVLRLLPSLQQVETVLVSP